MASLARVSYLKAHCAANRLLRTITGGDLTRHVTPPDPETMSDISELTDREEDGSSPTVFLEVKKQSPCNKRVNTGSLDRIEFCKECVQDNPTDGTWCSLSSFAYSQHSFMSLTQLSHTFTYNNNATRTQVRS